MLEGISLLGDTLWSVPVPIQGGRERVARLQDARERLNHSPGDFLAAYDLARYTADLGRYSQAITLFGDAAAMGGVDPRPYARRGELYLLLRKIDRGYSDLRTAERLANGDEFDEQQVSNSGEMQPRPFSYAVPHLLGIAGLVRGESTHAAEYFIASRLACHVVAGGDPDHALVPDQPARRGFPERAPTPLPAGGEHDAGECHAGPFARRRARPSRPGRWSMRTWSALPARRDFWPTESAKTPWRRSI